MKRVARATESDAARLDEGRRDADTGRIPGAAVFGVEGGEIASVPRVETIGSPFVALRDALFRAVRPGGIFRQPPRDLSAAMGKKP
jgi:hypothetical protein